MSDISRPDDQRRGRGSSSELGQGGAEGVRAPPSGRVDERVTGSNRRYEPGNVDSAPLQAFSTSPAADAFLSSPSLAAHSHLYPPTTPSRSHLSHLSPLRPSTRQLLKSRQAVAPPPSAVQAAKTALQRRLVARQLRGLGRAVEGAGEGVERGAEKVRRAVGGADARRRMEGFGQEIHDNLFQLLQFIADAQNPAFARFSSSSSSTSEISLAELAVRPAAIAAAAASPSPVPSGAASRSKRSLAAQPDDPLISLSALLSTLNHTLSAAASALPHLPNYQQEAIEALLEDVRGEVDLLAEGAVVRAGMGGVDLASGAGR
ncbi:hypothetical protein JCM6882_000616 [Rhodosporidiobolus microsporus]